MMILNKNANAVLTVVLANYLTRRPGVDAHGYLKSPRSRNYHASIDPIWFGGTANDPAPENCPHCLNIGGIEARCGKVGDHNYDYPPNAIGEGVLPPVIQACYEEGSIIDVQSVLTAHHKGHFEMRACPLNPGDVATQDCFDQYPLTFVEDPYYGAPPDPLYPERAYIPLAEHTTIRDTSSGDYLFQHRYKLPTGLTGDFILLQWYYVTANSCTDEGYDTYNFPEGFEPTNVPVCDVIPPDGRGTPEQFWNCAEVEIKVTNGCGTSSPVPPTPTLTPSAIPSKVPTSSPSGAPTPSPVIPVPTLLPTSSPSKIPTSVGNETTTTTTSTSINTGATVTTTTSTATPNPNCAAMSATCSATNPCPNGLCCSQWGHCGTSEAYCGNCCQGGPCFGAPAPSPPTVNPPTPPTPTPPTPGFNYEANHEDSRLIAYVGNWQSCPTDEQVDAYSHIVIAFAVSYTWNESQNNCDAQCNIASTVPICGNQNRQDLVDSWRAKGKKVILSFGGAGMGGSWSGDNNNCWDYCFGREEELSSDLVGIIDNQKFDGIDIDYEYCYDVAGTQSGRCAQRTNLYSDEKAQTFLDTMTSNLRVKLDALQSSNGYNRGRYEITHAPMDVDLDGTRYFDILRNRRADLDFIMPQFYNGVTRPGVDGIGGTGAGSVSAAALFSSLSNDLFDQEPHKVVFGFCIADCSGTGSNISSDVAVQVMSDLKSYDDGAFYCNGGAFFWVALSDTGGSWSDALVSEVSLTAGCSDLSSGSPTGPRTSSPSLPPTSSPTMAPITGTPSPTNSRTSTPTESPVRITSTTSTVTTTSTTASTPSPTGSPTSVPTDSPIETTTTTSSTTVNTGATVTTTSTTTSTMGELVIDTSPRCGYSEIDAREQCKPVCATDADCQSGEFCWNIHDNYCGSIPQRVYEDPAQSPVVSRCGVSEEMARTFCGEPCSWQCSKPGDACIAVHANYCDSPYTEVGGQTPTNPTPTTQTTTSSTTSDITTSGTGTATNNPTNSSTRSPTAPPSHSTPTTLFPSVSPTTRSPSSSTASAVESVLEANKDGIDNKLFLYQTPSLEWAPSDIYRYSDFLDGLRVMYNIGMANKFFYMGDDSEDGHLYGLVNIAAFLAQSMKETIKYNACDENSWDLVNGQYPLSNACGQLGQSYQDYKCSESEAHMECPVKKDMEIKATTNAKWWGAPAPLFCGPKEKYPFTGFWDHSKECNKPWANPPEYCEEYEGQKAGGFDNSSPVPNSSGRTDVEGCCFWGRGVIQTTGVCNFGKLNWFLGARAAEDGRDAMYPDIDFCEHPDAICSSEEHKELKWIAGMFYWVESLQAYDVGNWNYITELHKFVDNGLSGNGFIDAVSGIVNRGCHNPPCATGDVDGKADRSSNFFKVLTEFGLV